MALILIKRMKNNGYSHIKTSKELTLTQKQPSAIKSLRSIINETKVPLSSYINNQNQRCSIQKKSMMMIKKTRTKTSYFQRFRGMIGNGIHEKIQQETYVTPSKVGIQCENMEEEIPFDEEKTLDAINKSHLYRRTINHNDYSIVRNSRSISSNQRNSNLSKKHVKYNQRPSFQPTKNIKTEQQTIANISKPGLPPRPNNNLLLERKSNTRKPNLELLSEMPNSSRSRITKSSNQNNFPNTQNPEPTDQKSLTQMIEHIHSYRRLNFQKQQERKQIINYGKSFDKICQNPNFSHAQTIQSTPIQIKEVLGNGAFSYVKVGVVKGMSHKFAIKIYEKYKLIEPGRKGRVMKEIQILSSLNHPNIVKLYCAFENKREIHILFEQIEDSVTFQEYFKHMSLKFTNPKNLIFIMKEVLNGLEYLHSLGIAHRDIKADNILISFKENNPIVKIIDFGFATNTSMSNVHCGTPNFMAPELFRKQSYSPIKADIWAFGVMFYYLLESKYPFKGYNEKDLIRNICENRVNYEKAPIQIENLLSLIFQTNPDSRIQTKEVLRMLNKF